MLAGLKRAPTDMLASRLAGINLPAVIVLMGIKPPFVMTASKLKDNPTVSRGMPGNRGLTRQNNKSPIWEVTRQVAAARVDRWVRVAGR